jgi:hypothetical protein
MGSPLATDEGHLELPCTGVSLPQASVADGFSPVFARVSERCLVRSV